MPIYEIQLINTMTGKDTAYKFVKASSASFIRSHPSRYVGYPIRIGKIYEHTAKTLLGARRIHSKQNGYRVIGGTRMYGYKKEKTVGGILGLSF